MIHAIGLTQLQAHDIARIRRQGSRDELFERLSDITGSPPEWLREKLTEDFILTFMPFTDFRHRFFNNMLTHKVLGYSKQKTRLIGFTQAPEGIAGILMLNADLGGLFGRAFFEKESDDE